MDIINNMKGTLLGMFQIIGFCSLVIGYFLFLIIVATIGIAGFNLIGKFIMFLAESFPLTKI